MDLRARHGMREDLRIRDHLMHPNHMDNRDPKGLRNRGRPTDHLADTQEALQGDLHHHLHHRLHRRRLRRLLRIPHQAPQ